MDQDTKEAKAEKLAEIAYYTQKLEELGVRIVMREGVFVVIRNPKNREEILLVKHGYDTKKWSLPGGGIKQGELAINAAIREVADETGLIVNIHPNPIAHLSLQMKYGFTLLFEGYVSGGQIREKGDGEEITACGYFNKYNLPPMYNAQKGMIGWAEYHRNRKCKNVLYGHPNMPPLAEYQTK